ncbi:MAG: hypothetical protein ACOC5T_08465 [Elusimicrobiota bacterium]
MERKISNKKKLRYVYILEVDNRGNKSKYYGHSKIYYTGQTDKLGIRLIQHIKGINSNFLMKNFPYSRKKLVFVKCVYGTEYDNMKEEHKIKSKNISQKNKLIKGNDNMLVSYVPLKCIILKKYKEDGERVIKL